VTPISASREGNHIMADPGILNPKGSDAL